MYIIDCVRVGSNRACSHERAGGRPTERASIWALAPVFVLAGLLLSACDLIAAGEEASRTAPDIDPSVAAAVRTALAEQVARTSTPIPMATLTPLSTPTPIIALLPTPAHTPLATPDIEATVTAAVQAALAAQPTATPPSTPTPSPTDTPTPIPTPTPTPVPTLTATPAATRTPEAQFSEFEVSYRLQLYFAEQYELADSAYIEFLFRLANSPGDLFAASALGWDSEAVQREVWLWAGRYNGEMYPKYEGKGAWLVTVSDIVIGDGSYAPAEKWWFFERDGSPPLMARSGQ